MSDPRPLAPDLLSAEDTSRLLEFARAFKAAARAVALYPSAHPAIADTLRRLVEITSSVPLATALRLTVLPDTLLLDAHAPARPDPAIAELAELLHSHLIGALTVHTDGTVDDWQILLRLLGRTPEALRNEGGIARVWTATGRRHVEIRELDYAQVLREHAGGETATWDRLVSRCLLDDAPPRHDDDERELVDVASHAERLIQLVTELEARTRHVPDATTQATVIHRTLRATVDAVRKHQPEALEAAIRNIASAVSVLSPDALVDVLSPASHKTADGGALARAIVRRVSDDTVVRFVAQNVSSPTVPTERLAEAFHLLAGEPENRQRLLHFVHQDLTASPLGATPGFETAWQEIANRLLASFTDDGNASPGARTRATNVERAASDPPERLTEWLTTVAPSALRTLDLRLVTDLLRIETHDDRWAGLMPPIVALLEDLLLVGDFDAANRLVDILVREAATGASTMQRQSAVTAIDMLAAGSMMRSVVTHLPTMDDRRFAQVKAMCVSLGEVLVKPLAEALAMEQAGASHERLTTIVLAFGAIGRRTAERLKSSPNAAVRQTAIYLLREFGGNEALPHLTDLLADDEPQVQREAVRAILNIGTERAYEILEQALARGSAVSRDAIMQAMIGMRSDRAVPLFAYIVRHTDHRGPLGSVYLRAIESLGVLRDPSGVPPLDEALHRGEWWAPRRSARFRTAAATALARIGTPEAHAALQHISRTGPRGARSAARAQLRQLQTRAREQTKDVV